MSGQNSNGDHGAPPVAWDGHVDEIQRVADPPVRAALLMALERDREAWQQRYRHVRAFDVHAAAFVTFRKEQAERDGMVLAALARLEHKSDLLDARTEGTAVRVAVLTDDRERDHERLRELDERETLLAKGVAERAAKDTLDRVRLVGRVRTLEGRVVELDSEVTATGKVAAVAEDVADRALDRVSHVDPKERGLARRSRWWQRPLAKIIGPLALLLAGTVAKLIHWSFMGKR